MLSDLYCEVYYFPVKILMSIENDIRAHMIVRSHKIADFKATLQDNILCKKADDKIRKEYEKMQRFRRIRTYNREEQEQENHS